ncbi:MAG: HDOD domain-containing protein [Candidatus Eisenbacteria bacterium]|nr:HDOD domain-containing protein [Candidatus Eisenbacteria bacterium]
MKRILCVNDDSRDLEQWRRMLLERERGWEVRLATSNADALSVLQSWPPDAVIAAARPPVCDGVGLLSHIRDQRPETIRIVVGDICSTESSLRALKVVHRALPFTMDGDLLVDTLRRTLLMRDYVAQPQLRALLGQVGQLPAVPSVYAELTRRLTDPSVSVFELGELVAEDVALTTQVLRLANSAYFGRGQVVTRITDAAARLGTRLLRSLVLTAEVYGRMPVTPSLSNKIEALQRHASLVARIASGLDPRAAWKDDAFTAGLVHDIGKLLMISRLPELHARIEREAAASYRQEYEVEMEMLGAHHGTLGACLLGMWGLPSSVIEAVHGHHDLALEVPHSLNAARAVAIADRLAHAAADSEELKQCSEPLPMAVVTDPRWAWWREMAEQIANEGSVV